MARVGSVPPLLDASDPPGAVDRSYNPVVRRVPQRARGTGTIVPRFVIPALRWALAVEFVGAAAMKLTGQPATVALFAAVGFGQWFRYAVGSYELIGATLLVYPRTTVIGTIALSALMLGAARSEIFILDRLPLSSGVTLIGLVALGVLTRRWRDRR